MRKISSGAEAIIYQDGTDVIKHRIKKNYRIPEIDVSMRKSRTKREAKILKKLAVLKIPAPKVIEVDTKDMKITMELIEGKMIKSILEKSDYKKMCKKIGKQVARMHNNNIIHGDLTTSNMILKQRAKKREKYDRTENKIIFIDFGLGFVSKKLEDKAVDIHLFKQALESKHYRIFDEAFHEFVEGYKAESDDQEAIMHRFLLVESRGRNKKKGGN